MKRILRKQFPSYGNHEDVINVTAFDSADKSSVQQLSIGRMYEDHYIEIQRGTFIFPEMKSMQYKLAYQPTGGGGLKQIALSQWDDSLGQLVGVVMVPSTVTGGSSIIAGLNLQIGSISNKFREYEIKNAFREAYSNSSLYTIYNYSSGSPSYTVPVIHYTSGDPYIFPDNMEITTMETLQGQGQYSNTYLNCCGDPLHYFFYGDVPYYSTTEIPFFFDPEAWYESSQFQRHDDFWSSLGETKTSLTQDILTGLEGTRCMVEYSDSSFVFSSANTAWNYKAYEGDTLQWHLPSMGDMVLISQIYSAYHVSLDRYKFQIDKNHGEYKRYLTISDIPGTSSAYVSLRYFDRLIKDGIMTVRNKMYSEDGSGQMEQGYNAIVGFNPMCCQTTCPFPYYIYQAGSITLNRSSNDKLNPWDGNLVLPITYYDFEE